MRKIYLIVLCVVTLAFLLVGSVVKPVSAQSGVPQGATAQLGETPPFAVDLSEELLTGAVSIVMSLIFSYFPWVSRWYNKLSGDWKRVSMFVMLAVVTIGIYLMACGGLLAGVACTQGGIWQLVKLFIITLIANQSIDRISPKVGNKKSVKK